MKKQLFWILVALTVFVGFLIHKDTTSARDMSQSDGPSPLSAGTVIAAWSFEGVTVSATAGATPSITAGSAVADSGSQVSGSSFTGSHASASTVWSTPTGNGSTKCLSSTQWGQNDYYQFQFNTTGFTAISLTWDERGSNTGPRDIKVQYSTNGTTFTDATGTNSAITVTNDTWATSAANPVSTRTLDLSGVTALNNQATVFIRLVDNSTTSVNGGTVGTAGTDAVDNFTVSGTSSGGTPTPTPAPAVTSVAPTSGAATGGTSVAITGTNFSGATAVKFGATNATSFTVNSATSITATSPAGAAGTVDVTVTTPGGTSATSVADQFTYIAAPTVTSVSPTSGPLAGGTAVTITGTNFSTATAVKFGATNATSFSINSPTQITATSPGGTGTVDVTVTTTGGTSPTSAADQFTYSAVTPAPTVTSVSPASGPTAGGTPVTITGTNFTGATAVSFGGTAASGFTVNSATQITATSPAHAAGIVDVTVTTSGGTSAVSASDRFTYGAPAHVQHVMDFDGDGITDFSVLRDDLTGGQATWWNLSSKTGGLLNADFGNILTDWQEPADYDGDGHADIAVWRPPANGQDAMWYILKSTDGTATVTQFGSDNDIPDVVGDYDGDGKADIAVYRADLNTGLCTWWFRPSSGPLAGRNIPLQWGSATDIDNIDVPVPGDYNGDGKADMAVARSSANGQAMVWVHLGDGTANINTTNTVMPWGHYVTGDQSTRDAYVPGDYDGDGTTDYAVARVVNGQYQWWVRWSSDSSIHVATWGASSDDIVQGDYDGDGKTDLAVWRGTEGRFYIIASSTGTPFVKDWGNPTTDIATGNFQTH